MQAVKPVFWDGTNINLPPVFGWGSRIGSAPPNQRFPGFLNINRTQDLAASVTKLAGRHTWKAGFYNNHSYKAQNIGAGGVANLSFQGFVEIGAGRVLRGLMRTIDREIPTWNVEDPESLAATLEALKAPLPAGGA